MKEAQIAIVILLLIIAAGFAIRLDAAAEPMWLDECHTAWCVDTDSLHVVADRASDGNQPPLYFGLVWLATQCLGMSPFALRLVSLVSGLGLLVAGPLFAKSISDRWSAAALVAALIAFDGQFIFYAAESRSYALVQLLGLSQGIVFVSWLRYFYRDSGSGIRLVAWVLLSVLLLYCHYTSVWILAAETFAVLLAWLHWRRFPFGYWVALVAVGLSLIPRFWNVSMVFARRSNWGAVSSPDQWWIDVEPWLVHWLLLPSVVLFVDWLLPIINPGRYDRSAYWTNGLPNWSMTTWLLVWATFGLFGIALLDFFQIAPMALLRYSAVGWLAMALFAGSCLRNHQPKVAWLLAVMIFTFSFLFGNWWAKELKLHRYQALPTLRNEDWVGTVSLLSDSSDPVFQLADVIEDIDALSSADERFRRYLEFPIRGAAAVAGDEHLASDRSLFVIPTWNVQFNAEHLAAVREARGCWLLVRGDFDYAKLVPGELERYLGEPIEFKFIPNETMPADEVHLIRVRFQPPSEVDAADKE